MKMIRMTRLAGAAAALAAAAPAVAQRANENAAAKAEDAFGTSIGGEQIGIYSPGFVRGFSATEAGNIRLDGLYIDQQAAFTGRLVGGLQMRVGLSAQSYPFPAPTGIADFSLRLPGVERVVSTQLRYGPFGGVAGEVDAQIPLTKELSLGVGVGVSADRNHFGGDPLYISNAIMLRWRPSPKVEIIPFWDRLTVRSEEPPPLLFTDDQSLPPRVPRKVLLGQPWAENRGYTGNSGVIGRYQSGDWTVRAGLFHSVFDYDRSFAQLFLGVRPDGNALEAVIADPERRFSSVSGEVRLSRKHVEGDRLHTVHLAVRGRKRDRLYGGSQLLALGQHPLDEPVVFPEPDFSFGPQTRDRVEQLTAGIAYEGRWKNVGELSLGIQKTDYSKKVTTPAGPLPASVDRPWLFNGTIAAYLSPKVALYAGYTRGLEESPVAPDIAINKDEAPPAIRTRQIDAGFRWTIKPGLRLVAGLFEVVKPYYNLDSNRVFTRLGEIRHRGAEFSLAGQVAPGLIAVLGTALIDAELSGRAVESGALGRRPVASFRRLSNAIIEYRPPAFNALSVDLLLESTSDRIASFDGSFRIPAREIVSVGGRYRFKIGDNSATLRAQVANIFDNFGYSNGPSGVFLYNLPRRFTLSLTTDFR